MKKTLLFFCFLNSLISIAQTQDLAAIADGDNVQFNAFYDKQGKQLLGYFTLYDQGKKNDQIKKFEYVIFDRNLNKVANKEFEAESSVKRYVATMNVNNNLTLSPRVSADEVRQVGQRNFVYPVAKEINLKENTVFTKQKKCFENEKLVDCPDNKSFLQNKKDNKAERRAKGFVYESAVFETENNNYLVIDDEDYEDYQKNNRLMLLDKDEKLLWKYQYNQNGEKKKYEYLKILNYDKDKIFTILTKVDNKDRSYFLVVLDLKTGNIINQQDMEVPLMKSNTADVQTTLSYVTSMLTQTGDITNSKDFDDKIILLSRHYEKPIYSYYDLGGTGYTRIIIDKNTYQIKADNLLFSEMKADLPELEKNGYVKNNYYLAPRDIFFMKDGTVGILTEKYKDEGQYNAQKTSDFVYIFTDKDFKLKGIRTIKKEISRYDTTDYLFSNYINDDNDVVFFYNDNIKDESGNRITNLYINTLINGDFKQESIPIVSKKNVIIPYLAKEGYILLREYNEKEKYNKIRLEKLNY